MPDSIAIPDVRLVTLPRRFARSALLGAALVVLSLLASMVGYHYFEALPWLDAFSNVAMILSGMRPLCNHKYPPARCSPDFTRSTAAWRWC